MKISSKKLDNFWYYNRTYVKLFVLVLLLIVAVFAFHIMQDAEPDIHISYINRKLSPMKSSANFEKRLSSLVCDVNKDNIKKVQVSNVTDSFKAGLTLQAGTADVFISNRTRLVNVAEMGLLEPLDDIISTNNISLEDRFIIKLIAEGSNTAHIYGISLTDSKLLGEFNVDTSDVFLSIRTLSNMKKNVEKREDIRESAVAILNKLLE